MCKKHSAPALYSSEALFHLPKGNPKGWQLLQKNVLLFNKILCAIL